MIYFLSTLIEDLESIAVASQYLGQKITSKSRTLFLHVSPYRPSIHKRKEDLKKWTHFWERIMIRTMSLRKICGSPWYPWVWLCLNKVIIFVDNQVQMRALGWTLIQYDRHSYRKGKCGPRPQCAQKEDGGEMVTWSWRQRLDACRYMPRTPQAASHPQKLRRSQEGLCPESQRLGGPANAFLPNF